MMPRRIGNTSLSPTVVAGLLGHQTGRQTHPFDAHSLPFDWSDYPAGYSVFHTTLDIHTGQRPVVVYYKGDRPAVALTTAKKTLTREGFACQSIPSAAKRRARIVVTVEE